MSTVSNGKLFYETTLESFEEGFSCIPCLLLKRIDAC